MTNRELSWIDRELNALSENTTHSLLDYVSLPPDKYRQFLEALKAAREALWSCEIHSDQHRWFDADLLTSAIAQIDALGEEK